MVQRHLFLFLFGLVPVLTVGSVFADGNCGCSGSPVGAALLPAHHHVAPVAAGCGCSGGVAGLASVHAAAIGSAYGHVTPGTGIGISSGIHNGNAVSGFSSGLTGYEGLPNMDGGGTHQRYPYHSYRRPWANPGPQSTNITIVW